MFASYLASVAVQGQRRRGLRVSSKASVKVWWGWSLGRQAASWTWPAAPSRAFRGTGDVSAELPSLSLSHFL